MADKKESPKLEVIDTAEKFKFRLVSADGKRKTYWCGYTNVPTLDGYCGVTAYYAGHLVSHNPVVVTVEQYAELTCIGVNPNAN